MKTYKPEDYVFTDKNGKEYISTPIFPIANDLVFLFALGVSMIYIIGFTLALTWSAT